MRSTEQAALVKYEQVATNLLMAEIQDINMYDLADTFVCNEQAELTVDQAELAYTLNALRSQILTVLIRGALHTSYQPLYGPLPPVDRSEVNSLPQELLTRGVQCLADFIPDGALKE